ncbi:glycosyltransferase family 4 protein [Plantibacter sp. YIM 135249]|uniref:glycosyltransferase family 4 protein n=1 Tax=Plantibacter sp. YIM 135249 TaxID=3423918 RepID=UPI003D358685
MTDTGTPPTTADQVDDTTRKQTFRMGDAHTGTVLFANPSPDVYGSDLQMLESIEGLVEGGYRVVVALPRDGKLVPKLRSRGAEVLFVPFPVLRRANASAGGVASLAFDGLRSIRTLRGVIRSVKPDVVYVNTVTLPWWLIAARLSGVPAVCHVHEAETTDGRLVRFALNAPLGFANALIVISRASLEATCGAAPGLARKARLVFNGVPAPEVEPTALPIGAEPHRLAVVARLSPRKAPHVALDAVGLLRTAGRDVRIDVCGSPFAGYEWYEEELRERAEQHDLRGAVTFTGYVSPIWPALERAHIVVAPSLREPFGNAVVEAQLALRPVVASAALGHLETIQDGDTGLLVPPGDAQALADAIATILDDAELGARLARNSRTAALARFGVTRYRAEIISVIESVRLVRR